MMPNVEFVCAADMFHQREKDESDSEFWARLLKEFEEVFERIGVKTVISFR